MYFKYSHDYIGTFVFQFPDLCGESENDRDQLVKNDRELG